MVVGAARRRSWERDENGRKCDTRTVVSEGRERSWGIIFMVVGMWCIIDLFDNCHYRA